MAWQSAIYLGVYDNDLEFFFREFGGDFVVGLKLDLERSLFKEKGDGTKQMSSLLFGNKGVGWGSRIGASFVKTCQ